MWDPYFPEQIPQPPQVPQSKKPGPRPNGRSHGVIIAQPLSPPAPPPRKEPATKSESEETPVGPPPPPSRSVLNAFDF